MPGELRPVLIDGRWRPACATGSFRAFDPSTGEEVGDAFPVSDWADAQQALEAGARASEALLDVPADGIAAFLERYAERLEARADEVVAMAALETGLPAPTRLAVAELPRTTNQLRQAARCAREMDWARPVVDVSSGIHSCFGALDGPVVVFGPNNFPLAFNGVSGGDFAAAIAAGNPVIAKAHPCHPGTTRLLAEEAHRAAEECEMPVGTVQLLYRLGHAEGERLVSHPLVGATGYTGSRAAGLHLRTAALQAGKPIHLELSSVNPVFLLPGALDERSAEIVDELRNSSLLGTGQFCTNPGLVVIPAGPGGDAFATALVGLLAEAPAGLLLGRGVLRNLGDAVRVVREAGAELLLGGAPVEGPGFRYQNTLLRVSGQRFLERPRAFQTEMFGNACLIVVAADREQSVAIARQLEGNLTGCLYCHTDGRDDAAYGAVVRVLRRRVGRLLNDKMPTGVAVVPSMNHGGPFPATGDPGHTAVGLPASMLRFAALHCYDNVGLHRLPAPLRDIGPAGRVSPAKPPSHR